MPDLPSMLAGIRTNPDHEPHWLALAAHYRDNGRDDEAAVLRVFWRTIRDNMAMGKSLEAGLADMATHAKLLGKVAREVEERTVTTPRD